MGWDLYGDARRSEIGAYDVAEICLSGHITNSSVKQYPEDSMRFCDLCGELTIQACPACNASIRGDSVEFSSSYDLPSYCTDCGSAFPWIKAKLDAARELFDIIDEFTERDREILNANLDDLVRETPRTQVASLKVKKSLAKVSSSVVSAFRDILVDVLSEAAKKTIWPNS